MVRVVLLGLPGSGKSTQAAMIAGFYSVPVVSPGELLRDAVKRGTEIGRQAQAYLERGELAPNHLVDQLVFQKLKRCDGGKAFVLDGFPRTLEQAGSLDDFMRQVGEKLTAVIYLHVPPEVVVSRLSARRQCPVCGAIYNLVYNAPRSGELCYACHSPLRYVGKNVLECEACRTPFVQREDDRPEVIRRRLQIQQRALKPVLTHFRNLGLLAQVDATRSPEQVFADIQGLLSGKERQVGGVR